MIWMLDTNILIYLTNRKPGFEKIARRMSGRSPGEVRLSGGKSIGPYDLLIAAHARQIDAVLVTSNEREFRRVPGLSLENWLQT